MVAGIIAEAATPTEFGAINPETGRLWSLFPPTIFVRMERDGAAADAQHNIALLRSGGVPANVIVVSAAPAGAGGAGLGSCRR